MFGGATATLVVLVLLVMLAFRRAHFESGTKPTWRQRVALGLGVFAVLFSTLVLAALARTAAPISQLEWLEALGLSALIGAIPLAAWLALDAAVRYTRLWEAKRALRRNTA
jgi:hypothetical protein